jgi:hypothetical protein
MEIDGFVWEKKAYTNACISIFGEVYSLQHENEAFFSHTNPSISIFGSNLSGLVIPCRSERW